LWSPPTGVNAKAAAEEEEEEEEEVVVVVVVVDEMFNNSVISTVSISHITKIETNE
jgi:hypothetical protein